MFTKSAHFYDAIYGFKDYEGESKQLHALIQKHKHSNGSTLLDVAFGTGGHIPYLGVHYQVQELDLDDELLAVARTRHPNILFHQGDTVDFELAERFDVITCLFSAIGYVKTEERLRQAIQTIADHLSLEGVLIVEPWFNPDVWVAGRPHMLNIDEPDLKITRMNVSEREGDLAVIEFHYLVGTAEGIDYFSERHELALFHSAIYIITFEAAGLQTYHDPEGLMDRGLFVGIKPLF